MVAGMVQHSALEASKKSGLVPPLWAAVAAQQRHTQRGKATSELSYPG